MTPLLVRVHTFEACRFFAETTFSIRAIIQTAGLNNRGCNLTFMTISVLASGGGARSTAFNVGRNQPLCFGADL
jgi:hypothetical protein